MHKSLKIENTLVFGVRWLNNGLTHCKSGYYTNILPNKTEQMIYKILNISILQEVLPNTFCSFNRTKSVRLNILYLFDYQKVKCTNVRLCSLKKGLKSAIKAFRAVKSRFLVEPRSNIGVKNKN